MSKTAAEKLASGVIKLQEEKKRLEKKAQDLEEQQELFEKRAQAEEILLAAQEKPSKLNVATVDDFLAKRANLEEQSEEQLEKIANAIEYLDESDGIVLRDDDNSEKQDLTSWLEDQATQF